MQPVIWRKEARRLRKALYNVFISGNTGLLFHCLKSCMQPWQTHQTVVASRPGHNPVRCVWWPTAGCRFEWARPSGSDRLAGGPGPVLRSLRVPRQTSARSGLRRGSFTACFHVPFNEETAGSPAGRKTHAN